ncbi:MAG: glycoside hydrolase family 15 protein [Xenococcus sp. MO_188.B8]|nr:glycoside hydrolase family 15 protein [Xenococcus sp. MO_188.B8]
MESFRQEIIETQKARSDLLKWKLIISAALAAVGLGLNPTNSSNYDSPVDLAFCLIPFVCTYVDLLCYHLNLRMFVISKFFKRLQANKLREGNKIDKDWKSWQDIYLFQQYEKTCGEVRSAFDLESLALKWSTIIISLIVIVVSYYADDKIDAVWLVLAGTFGVLAAWLNQILYDNKARNLNDINLSPISFVNKSKSRSQKKDYRYLPSMLKQKRWRKNLNKYFENLINIDTLFFLVPLTIIVIGFGLLALYTIKQQKGGGEGLLFIGSGILLILGSTLIENFFYRNKINKYSKLINNLNKNFPWSDEEDLWVGTLLIIITRFYFSTDCFSLITREDSCQETIKFKDLNLSVNIISDRIVILLTIISLFLVIYICYLFIKNIRELDRRKIYLYRYMLQDKNQRLLKLLKIKYNKPREINKICNFLEEQGTFNDYRLKNDLFQAAMLEEEAEYTGYSSIWVRDNIYVAYSYYLIGQTDVAKKNVRTLMTYFQKHKQRFEAIIEGKVNPSEIMQRPHIRFDGHNLEEIDQEWNHAQNDALGYFLWFYCKLARDNKIKPDQNDLETLALFPHYFKSIAYWQDEDSGHWEEDRKIEASSIGVVVAGLKELKKLLQTNNDYASDKYKGKSVTIGFLKDLINRGTSSLNNILPFECRQAAPKQRRYDAALLFLIYPLQVVEGEMADQILNDVIENLQGDYGIRRYLGDSFWCRDYKDIPEEIRTTISSEREQWFKENDRELILGEEAQWCIFDPIVSAIFGLKFQETGQQEYLEQQIHYLNRSLGQLTGRDCQFGEFKCPELYYLQHDQYVPGDATPLLWTQANLRIALKKMESSLNMIANQIKITAPNNP